MTITIKLYFFKVEARAINSLLGLYAGISAMAECRLDSAIFVGNGADSAIFAESKLFFVIFAESKIREYLFCPPPICHFKIHILLQIKNAKF
ncbi:hypothetical protein ACWIUD_05885 [Helicobacter sp. 23-1044]